MRKKFRSERSEGAERPASEVQPYFRHIQLPDQCLMVRHQNEMMESMESLEVCYINCGLNFRMHHKEASLYSDRESPFDS